MLKLVARDRRREAGGSPGGAGILMRSSLPQPWGEGTDDVDVRCADVRNIYAHTAL